MNSRFLKISISFFISFAIVVWLIFAINWEEVWQQLLSVHYIYLLPVLVLIIIQFILRAIRWRYLLSDPKSLTIKLSFDSIMAGNFVNYILPLRAGEFFRAYFLSRYSQNSFSNYFAAVVIERFFDLCTVLLMFAITLSAFSGFPGWVNQGAISLGVLAILILIYIIAAITLPSQIRAISNKLISFFPKFLQSFFNNLLDGLFTGAAALKNIKQLVYVIILSILVWVVTVLQYHVLFYMFDFEISIWHGTLVTVIVALAVAAPSAPGFVGVIQIATIAAFSLLGLSKEHALTYSLLSHIEMFIFVILYGLYLQYKYSIKMNQVKLESND